jgi:hypothetical protein
MEIATTTGVMLTIDRFNELIEAENLVRKMEGMTLAQVSAQLLAKTHRYFVTERGKPGIWYPWDSELHGIKLGFPLEVPECPGENGGEWWRDERGLLCADTIWGRNF